MNTTIAQRENRRPRIHEKVTRTLLGEIITGRLPVGARLPTERKMAHAFQVNRATVREALRHLELLELVFIRQGDGAYVRNYLESGNLEVAKALLDVDDTLRYRILEAVLEVRRINGPAMAATAACNRSDDHVRQLEALAANRHGQSVMERDRQIHHTIGLASGNLLYILMINFFDDFFDTFAPSYFRNDANVRRSERFHREIAAAIRRQEADRAEKVMRDVLIYAGKAVRETLPTP